MAQRKCMKIKKASGGRGVVVLKKIRAKPISTSVKCGLVFPVARIDRFLRKLNKVKRVGVSASIFLTAILEYLACELVEAAGLACMANKKKRITPRHVLLAVKKDEEMSTLLRAVTICGGGVLPNIHGELLPKRSGKPVEAKQVASQSM